jgi:uncharacterized NAD(P)/FAD-binding protein YdhS
LSNVRFDVVIVGGGFSGTLLSVQLSRSAPTRSVAVVDNGPLPGRGVAYSTRYSCHLLNVPAGNMSALPDEPDHFLNWAKANYEPTVQPTNFLPRAIYGRYVGSILRESAGRDSGNKVQWITGEISSVSREQGGIELLLADGRTLRTKLLVLALGNFPPANLHIPGLSANSTRYVRSPWSASALCDIPMDGSVLLIGSGLTSVDLAVALKSDGFTGHIHILSRRGLMPQTHRRIEGSYQFGHEKHPTTIRELLHLVRKKARDISVAGGDWREVIDSLRPMTQQIWQSLPEAERKRFLRHVRSYWDIHRHRIAPEIGNTIANLVDEGQAIVHAGRLTKYQEFEDHAEVELRDRKTGARRTLSVDRVINCTGPETDCRRVENSLIKNLLAGGLARPDPLFLGLDADPHGALIDSRGSASSSIYVIGPARKGSLWETIAVPELRVQAAELAELLASSLNTDTHCDHAVVMAGKNQD